MKNQIDPLKVYRTSSPIKGTELYPNGGTRASITLPIGRWLRKVESIGPCMKCEYSSDGDNWYPAHVPNLIEHSGGLQVDLNG